VKSAPAISRRHQSQSAANEQAGKWALKTLYGECVSTCMHACVHMYLHAWWWETWWLSVLQKEN